VLYGCAGWLRFPSTCSFSHVRAPDSAQGPAIVAILQDSNVAHPLPVLYVLCLPFRLSSLMLLYDLRASAHASTACAASPALAYVVHTPRPGVLRIERTADALAVVEIDTVAAISALALHSRLPLLAYSTSTGCVHIYRASDA
jgi:hypothetical protein